MSEFDTAYVRGKLSRAWANRDWHSIRFYGSWLIWGKWPTLPILGGVVGITVGILLTDWITNG